MGLINPWSIGLLVLIFVMFLIMALVTWNASNGGFSDGCERCHRPLADNEMANGSWICDECYLDEVDRTMDRTIDRETRENA